MSRKRFLLLMGALLLAVCLKWGYARWSGVIWRPALSSREIATRRLAAELARRYPGAKALVMGNPFTQRGGQPAEIYSFEKASVRGLERGFGSPQAIKVAYPALRPEFLRAPEKVYIDPKTTTPLSFLVAENAFDELVAANPGFDLVVSLIGLPVNLPQTQVWRDRVKPRFGLVLPDWRMVGSTQAIREAVKSDKIVAAVIDRPGVRSEANNAPSGDEQAQFNRRFLLVTKENVDELLVVYPNLFW